MPARERRRAIIKNTIEPLFAGNGHVAPVRLQIRECASSRMRGYGDACLIVDDSSFLLDTGTRRTVPMNEAAREAAFDSAHPLAENICHARGFHLC